MKLILSIIVFVFCLAAAQNQNERFIELSVDGASHTGHYKVQDAEGCIFDHSWSITYSSYLEKPSGNTIETLGLLMLEVPDASDVSRFRLVAGFGDYDASDYREYILDPVNKTGSGSVLIQKDGKYAHLTVTGTTHDGVNLEATFECLDVLDLTGDTPLISDLALTFPADTSVPSGSLELTFGAHHYHVQTGQEATCEKGVGVINDLWYTYDPGGSYTGVMLIIQDLEQAKTGTANFGFNIDMHPYHVPGDSGSAFVTQEGNRVTIRAEQTSPEGIPISVVVTCSLTD